MDEEDVDESSRSRTPSLADRYDFAKTFESDTRVDKIESLSTISFGVRTAHPP